MSCFKGDAPDIQTQTRKSVKLIHLSVHALGAVIRSSFYIVFFPSIVSTAFQMAQNQAVRKPDWTSRKCSDVNQPSVQDRKADSPKLLLKLRQTVSL